MSKGSEPRGKQNSKAKKLNPRHEIFAREYLVDLNATAAYQRVYKCTEGVARRNGSRLLSNVDIQALIQRLRLERQHRTEITADRIIQEWARIAFSDIAAVIDFDGNSVQLRKSQDLSPDVTAALETVATTVSETEFGTKVSYKVKMHNKVAALQQLGKLMGLDLQGSIDAVIRAGYEVLDPRTGEPIGATGTEETYTENDSED